MNDGSRAIRKSLLQSKYRRELWINTKRILNRLKRALPMTETYLLGSFTTKKKRPADVDLIVLVKTKSKKKERWSVDLVLAPDNKHGAFILEDTKKWMQQKYGAKKSAVIRIQ